MGGLLGHLRWALSYSLYHGGLVARVIREASGVQAFSLFQRPAGSETARLDKGTALMLADGDWAGLDEVTGLAFRTRSTAAGEPRPNDRYYRADTLRYQFRVSEAA